MNAKIDSTVPNGVRTILADSLRRQSFKSSKFPRKISASKSDNKSETQKDGTVDNSGKKRKKRRHWRSGTPAPVDTNAPWNRLFLLHDNKKNLPFRNINCGRGEGRFFGKGGGRGNGRGSGSNNQVRLLLIVWMLLI